MSVKDYENIKYMDSKVMVKNFVQNLANIFETPKALMRTLQTALGIATGMQAAAGVVTIVGPTVNELISYLHLVSTGLNTRISFCNRIIDTTPQLFGDSIDNIPPLYWKDKPIPEIGARSIPDLVKINVTTFKSEKDHTDHIPDDKYEYIVTSKDKVLNDITCKRDVQTNRAKINLKRSSDVAPDVIVNVRPAF